MALFCNFEKFSSSMYMIYGLLLISIRQSANGYIWFRFWPILPISLDIGANSTAPHSQAVMSNFAQTLPVCRGTLSDESHRRRGETALTSASNGKNIEKIMIFSKKIAKFSNSFAQMREKQRSNRKSDEMNPPEPISNSSNTITVWRKKVTLSLQGQNQFLTLFQIFEKMIM